MVQVERRTQYMSLSASFNLEPVSMTSRLMRHGGGLVLWPLRCAKLQRHRRQQGDGRSSTTPSSWRAQASPTRPEQPSLASVGDGMAAGAAFAHPRAADARVRPISFNHM